MHTSLRRSLLGAAAVAATTVGLTLTTAILAPGVASATTYTCSDGHLYADGQHVRGDTVSQNGVTFGCNGDRVVGTIG